MSVEPEEILFVGLGKSAVMWYRCALPALHMGADWVGIQGTPPSPHVATGLVKNRTALPRYEDYKVVFVQQPMGVRWLAQIKELQSRGIKVVFEVDDYLHGVRKQKGHDFAKGYDKKALQKLELNMRVCDAMVCSTEWLGKKYRSFNKRIFVCENGLDIARYRLTKPPRDTITIGWAGATGHIEPMRPWLAAIAKVMEQRPNVNFVAIGQPGYAQPFADAFPGRSLGVPWTTIENYPAAMTLMDIAIAPAGKTSWYRGKSDLRWLEAGALGTPIVADPIVYPRIEHGVNGFHAESYAEISETLLTLVDDPELRRSVGDAAKRYVEEHRNITRMAGNWLELARLLVDDRESVPA